MTGFQDGCSGLLLRRTFRTDSQDRLSVWTLRMDFHVPSSTFRTDFKNRLLEQTYRTDFQDVISGQMFRTDFLNQISDVLMFSSDC